MVAPSASGGGTGIHRAYISLGSNVGDKLANCRTALRRLAGGGSARILARSPFYRTEPVGFREQDWFLNAVVEVETELDPPALLKALQDIQVRGGRIRDPVRFGPRRIDLDILFFDDRVVDTPELKIPHPRLHERRFVLRPLCDLRPGLIHPVLRTEVRSLLDALEETGQEVVAYPCSDCSFS